MSITFHPQGIYNEDLTLNVAEGNALVPCVFMHADYDMGRIPVRDLDEALEALAIANLSAHTRESVWEESEGHMVVVNCALPFERLEQYWDRLHDILQYCKKHELPMEWD